MNTYQEALMELKRVLGEMAALKAMNERLMITVDSRIAELETRKRITMKKLLIKFDRFWQYYWIPIVMLVFLSLTLIDFVSCFLFGGLCRIWAGG